MLSLVLLSGDPTSGLNSGGATPAADVDGENGLREGIEEVTAVDDKKGGKLVCPMVLHVPVAAAADGTNEGAGGCVRSPCGCNGGVKERFVWEVVAADDPS